MALLILFFSVPLSFHEDGMKAIWLFSWKIVRDEMMSFFREFHELDSFMKSLNANFFILKPKKGGDEDMSGVWSISLVGGF